MIECAFFRSDADSVTGISAYADIPEQDYIDLVRVPSVESLGELCALLGLDASRSFDIVHDPPGAAILRAGDEFERALLTRTTDDLSDVAVRWARSAAWQDVNPMDVIGALMFLAGHWAAMTGPRKAMYVWTRHGA